MAIYDHLSRGLSALAAGARSNKFKRLGTKDIELLETASIKFMTLQASLKDSRAANALLQKQIDQLRKYIPEGTMKLLMGESNNG